VNVGHPPFLLELDEGILRPVGGADSVADYDRLRAAPAAAQAVYLANYGTSNVPCAWLNEVEKRCEYYDFRPDICRSFEVGGKWCSRLRELHQVE
jgi:Fe-S-cluster containining protein